MTKVTLRDAFNGVLFSAAPNLEKAVAPSKPMTGSQDLKPSLSSSGPGDLRDQLIAAQRKLLIFYEEEWDGDKPPPILVRWLS